MDSAECLETRLLSGLIVGGADVKYHVAGKVKAADLTDPDRGAIYRLIMEIPPMTDDATRQRLLDELALFIRPRLENNDDARLWARKRISTLEGACDTTDGDELAAIAQTLHRCAVAREIGIGDGLHMLLAGEELTYAQIRQAMEEDGWTVETIKAALEFERDRGTLSCRVVGRQSVWSIPEKMQEAA